MTALINSTKQQPLIGGQSKNWQNLDGVISLDTCLLMLDSGCNGLVQRTSYSGVDTSHIFSNGSNAGKGSDRVYSEASYVLDTDIDAINQIEVTLVNLVDNTDASALADSGDVFVSSEDTLAKKTRQRVSGILLRAVVLQVVIIAIWLLA
jgi:hypothetical protein